MKTRSTNGLVVLAAVLLTLGLVAAGAVMLTKPGAPTIFNTDNAPNLAVSGSSNAPKQLAVGQPAPDFTLNTLDGQPLALKDLRGKKVLVNFWASWCGPCVKEMPALQAAYDQLQTSEGADKVAFVGVGTQDKLANLQTFIKDNGIRYPTVDDAEGTVGDAYLILGLPVTVFIDSAGIVQKVNVGPINQDQVVQAFNAMQ